MDKFKEPVLQALKQAFPNLEISTISTNQRGNKKLIIVKGFSEAGNIDDWSVDTVYPIWWKMIEILDKYKSNSGSFRLLFIRDNQFMLHSPNIGFGNVFRKFDKPLCKYVYGDFERQHYIGECQNINDVIEYLTSTNAWF